MFIVWTLLSVARPSLLYMFRSSYMLVLLSGVIRCSRIVCASQIRITVSVGFWQVLKSLPIAENK